MPLLVAGEEKKESKLILRQRILAQWSKRGAMLSLSIHGCVPQPDPHGYRVAGLGLTRQQRTMFYGMDTTDLLDCSRISFSVL